MYRVVSFRDAQEVGIISSRWWVQQEGPQDDERRPLGYAWWPKKKSGLSVNMLIKSKSERMPETKNWKLHPARSLLATDDIIEARRIEKAAVFTSDVAPTDNELEDDAGRPRRRLAQAQQPPKHRHSSTSSEDDADEGPSLVAPPPVPDTLSLEDRDVTRRSGAYHPCSDPFQRRDVVQRGEMEDLPAPGGKSIIQPSDVAPEMQRATLSAVNHGRAQPPTTSSPTGGKENRPPVDAATPSGSYKRCEGDVIKSGPSAKRGRFESNSEHQMASTSTPTRRTTDGNLSVMVARLLKTAEANNKLLCSLAADVRELKRTRGGKNLPALPVQSREELEGMNRMLADQLMFDKLADYLKGWCSPTSTLRQNIRFLMMQVIGGGLSGQLSLSGKNGKPAIKGTRVFSVLCQVLKDAGVRCDAPTVGKAVTTWLSGSSDRNGGRAERMLRHRMRTASAAQPTAAATSAASQPTAAAPSAASTSRLEDQEEIEVGFEDM